MQISKKIVDPPLGFHNLHHRSTGVQNWGILETVEGYSLNSRKKSSASNVRRSQLLQPSDALPDNIVKRHLIIALLDFVAP